MERTDSPRANSCRRTPSCPRRSESCSTGNAASAAQVYMPHRSKVSRISAEGERTPIGRRPSHAASSPAGITVIPEKPRAARTAASILQATATFATRPRPPARVPSPASQYLLQSRIKNLARQDRRRSCPARHLPFAAKPTSPGPAKPHARPSPASATDDEFRSRKIVPLATSSFPTRFRLLRRLRSLPPRSIAARRPRSAQARDPEEWLLAARPPAP